MNVAAWVPLVSAGIAVLGVLLSQWITASVAKKRLTTEGMRERLRLEHEDRKDMRARRLEVYSDFLDSWEKWMYAIETSAQVVSLLGDQDKIDPQITADIKTSSGEILRALHQIRLIGSKEVRHIAHEARELGVATSVKLVWPELIAKLSKKDAVAAVKRFHAETDPLTARLESAFRRDLGTTSEITPSQPSEMTS